LDFKALTKIQSVALIAVIIVAAVAGILAYLSFVKPIQSAETIKIGICADLDSTIGKGVWRAAVLAAEQVNAEGGVLGRNFTIVAEDDDDEAATVDLAVASNAMTKLIIVDKANYVISAAQGAGPVFAHQDICAEHKTIIFGVRASLDNFTQRVIDNYDRYNCYFKLWASNSTTVAAGTLGDVLALANLTGFTKVAFLGIDSTAAKQVSALLNKSLPQYGLTLVYTGLFPSTTTDFTSYFATIENTQAEILVPFITGQNAVSFVKEWHDRESPFVVFGSITLAQDSSFWSLTEGKCEYISFAGVPVLSGYPLTNKTIPTREAYLQRWGSAIPSAAAVAVYDGIRFILPDAIKRAKTSETGAVVKALEETDVETSMARHFVFTSSHDLFIGAAGPNKARENYVLVANFQYQANGTVAITNPIEFMKETSGTYQFPSWQGAWSNKQIP
jgi:ABC-type branched-subunit amino acid transport system substrate-binding protein